MLVVGVAGFVQLKRQPDNVEWPVSRKEKGTNQFQDGDFHHTLIEISRLVFDHFDGHDLVRLHVLTLDHLAKGPLPQNVQNEVPTKSISGSHVKQRVRKAYLCPSSVPSQSLT
jgi:hypothetical protein